MRRILDLYSKMLERHFLQTDRPPVFLQESEFADVSDPITARIKLYGTEIIDNTVPDNDFVLENLADLIFYLN